MSSEHLRPDIKPPQETDLINDAPQNPAKILELEQNYKASRNRILHDLYKEGQLSSQDFDSLLFQIKD